MTRFSDNKIIIIWLSCLILMVFAMVFIGGVTRLTDSGLSMVDWKPIVGAIPPLNHEQWLDAFSKYQAYPEFQKINFNMTLGEFKGIFFWEYFHRLFGRLIGIAFILPFAYLVLKRKITTPLSKKIFVAFILGGLQGLMGWYMVKSGLVNRPDVSQYRLCAHLLLAFFIIGYLYYIILGIRNCERVRDHNKPLSHLIIFFFMILILQIAYGAFVAGLDAGLTHNTFPKMGKSWLPNDMFYLSPFINNFFENIVLVQFIHRTLGWVLSALGLVILIRLKKVNDFVQKKSIKFVLLMLLIQFLLGVSTLLLQVPITMASIHQLGAVILFLLTISAVYYSHTSKS